MARRANTKSAYSSALKEARKTGYQITRDTVDTLKTGFEDAIRDLVRNQSKNPLVASQQREMRKELRKMLSELEKLSKKTVASGVDATIQDIVNIHSDVVKGLVKGVAGTASARKAIQVFNRIPIRAVAAMNAGRNAVPFRALIERSIVDAAPELDIMLTRAIAQGMSPARLTKDVANLLAGDDPKGLLDYDLESKDVSGVRTLFSDARRIAVSETNNALREANTISLQESPVLAATWQRSGRHEALNQKRDKCDDYAEQDRFGLGAGMWLIEHWPKAPHPYCACVQGGPVVYMSIEDWIGMRGLEDPGDMNEEE